MAQPEQQTNSRRNWIDKQRDTTRTQLTSGAMGSFIIKILSTALTFSTSILLARILGAEKFGYYTYALTIINLLIVPAKLGLPNLIVRHTAAYKYKKQWNLLRGLLLCTNRAVLVMSLVIITISFLAAWKLSAYIPSLSVPVFSIALLMLPLMGLSALQGATLRGLNHVLRGQLPEYIIRQAAFIALVILLVLYSTKELNSSLVMSLQVLATLIAFTASIFLLFKHLPEPVKRITAKYDMQSWIRSAMPLLIVSGMNIINKRTDIIMLGIFTNSEVVGIYQVVTRGAELIIFSLFAVNMAVAPVFSRLYANKEMEKLQNIVTTSSLAILAFSLPAALILIVFGSRILPYVFGIEFAAGSAALAILSTGQLINASIGSVFFLLNMTGHEKTSAKGLSIAAAMNIILNLIFIPQWGIEGAAAATTTSIVIWNLLMAYFVYKKLNIFPSILGLFYKNKTH